MSRSGMALIGAVFSYSSSRLCIPAPQAREREAEGVV